MSGPIVPVGTVMRELGSHEFVAHGPDSDAPDAVLERREWKATLIGYPTDATAPDLLIVVMTGVRPRTVYDFLAGVDGALNVSTLIYPAAWPAAALAALAQALDLFHDAVPGEQVFHVHDEQPETPLERARRTGRTEIR